MRGAFVTLFLFAVAGLAGCLSPTDSGEEVVARDGRDDVVVVAVLDWQINPYHWDFLAAHMPQHNDGDAATDLPLWDDPADWLPGFPDRDTFASYGALHLSLDADDPDAVPGELYDQDESEWAKVERTTQDGVHFHYIPGTKIVGLITTGNGDGFAPSSHGGGASSVSVGNLHGTCPHCLLVFVDIPGAAGEEWVRQQDWIDATTHSYEGSTTGVMRDNIRDCDTSLTRTAAERGQQIFWAAGNGLMNTFTVPQTTLVNCQKGPDWTVTVGAIHPESEASYTGHGKPVHVSSIGQSYPSAGGASVTAQGSFSGTSNASPVAAGLYAEALYQLRVATPGSQRMQADGVILEGSWQCGDAQPDCPLADGQLTAHELREAYFQAAQRIQSGFHVGIAPGPGIPAETEESEVWTRGHGTWMGRLGDWEGEVQAIVDQVTGHAPRPNDPDLDAWMTAYSWCVQQVWGTWDHGRWQSGQSLPGADPQWPQRTWMASPVCPLTVEAALQRI